MVNDPSRTDRENADISALLKVRKNKGRTIDWELLEEYFALFDREDQLNHLKREHG